MKRMQWLWAGLVALVLGLSLLLGATSPAYAIEPVPNPGTCGGHDLGGGCFIQPTPTPQ